MGCTCDLKTYIRVLIVFSSVVFTQFHILYLENKNASVPLYPQAQARSKYELHNARIFLAGETSHFLLV